MVLLQDGSLHAMGYKDRCGRENATDHFYCPVLVKVGNNSKIARIACCSQACTIVETVNHEWYAFGDPAEQRKPAFGKAISKTAIRIDDVFPKNCEVKKIVSTIYSFFMLCANGDLFVVGNGGFGEMGINNGKNIDQWTLCKQNVVDVQTGAYNSFVFLK